MATVVGLDLDYLVDQFLMLSKTVYRDMWARMDIAAQTYRAFGVDGLRVLADRTGYKVGTLKGWVMTSNAFPDRLRKPYPHVSPEVFTTVRQGIKHFHPTSRWYNPAVWLAQAEEHRWNHMTMRAALRRQHLMVELQVPEKAAEARQAALRERVEAAEQHLIDLQLAIDQFNRVDAPYACVTVSLTQTLYQPV